MELFSAVLQFEDVRGEEVTVRMPPILVAEEIRARVEDLVGYLGKPHLSDLTFAEAYSSNKKLRRKVNDVLSILDIDGSMLNIDIIAQLLFPHQAYDEEGKQVFVPQGALIQFVFGHSKGGKPKSVDMDEVYKIENFMGDLWAATEDWFETLELMKTLSYNDLNKVLSARNWAMRSPEDKMKYNQQKASKKLMENLKAGKISSKAPKEASDKPLSEEEMSKFFA